MQSENRILYTWTERVKVLRMIPDYALDTDREEWRETKIVDRVLEGHTSRYSRQYMLSNETKIGVCPLIIPDGVLEICSKLGIIQIRGTEVHTQPFRCTLCDLWRRSAVAKSRK